MKIIEENLPKETDKEDICEKSTGKDEKILKRKNRKKGLLISIFAIIVSIIVIAVVVYLVIKGNHDKNGENKDDTSSGTKQNQENFEKSETSGERVGPKEKEFDIKTWPGDLKKISVIQKSKDETKINN